MLQETVLANSHRELGGKLVDFGGWAMPVNYGSQMEEHHSVRRSAGMFDVSHMTVVDVKGVDAQGYLQVLLANDVGRLVMGKALYSAMLNDAGGVIDDLIVYRTEAGFRLVVNCATREKDLAWMQAHVANFAVEINERADLAIIAVQGPNARDKVNALLNDKSIASLAVFFGACPEAKPEWFVARTGYTGEDGYEIILPEKDALGFWQSLLSAGVSPCGLGARDTLRLEAGMNLYGHEMDESISPLSANMGWTIEWEPDERAFIGRPALEALRSKVEDKLVGLVLLGKGVLRAEQTVHCSEVELNGVVTSGTYSPTLGQSIALARVPKAFSGECEVEIRNKRQGVRIVKPCFVRHGEKICLK